MNPFGKKMTFEEEQLAHERAREFDDRVEKILDSKGDDVKVEDVIAAINEASVEMDPDHRELKYELDEDAGENDY